MNFAQFEQRRIKGKGESVAQWTLAGIVGMIAVVGACGRQVREQIPDKLTVNVPTSNAPDVFPVAKIPDIQLRDVSRSSGISFRHFDGGSGKKYLIEPMSAGLALLDYDGDGLIDIFLLSGAPLKPLPPDSRIRSALYRNEGDFHFRDVTIAAGVGSTSFGLGVSAADYDNDGDEDLYLNNFGRNVLFRNNGDGTFQDVANESGVAVGDHAGAGAAFLDADADGNLDLFAANYVAFTIDQNPAFTVDGFPRYPGPHDFPPDRNKFFQSDGAGSWIDASVSSGIASVAGSGMGILAADFDNDGDSDVFVANDERGNFLFENDGAGRFAEVGVMRGFAYGFDGRPRGGMGIDCADYDRDGLLDFFITTYSNETCVLFHNINGQFEDATAATGAGAGSFPHAKWGTAFADFDNDADADLFLACGHINQEVHRWRPNTAYCVANILLENQTGKFVDISHQCGDGLKPVLSSRGCGMDDLDNDGDLDLVVLNANDVPTIIRNDSQTNGHWLQIELLGRNSNRGGVGAQTRITVDGRTQLAEVHSGRGYQSHHGTRLHFGLGSAERVERIEVRWIGGGTDILTNVPVDRLLRIVEGVANADH